jgi:hypothetical protein
MLRTDVLLMSDSTTVAVGTVARSLEIGGPDGCEHARRDLAAAGQLAGDDAAAGDHERRRLGGHASLRTGRARSAAIHVDLVPHGDGLYFMLGDVSGKGVAHRCSGDRHANRHVL